MSLSSPFLLAFVREGQEDFVKSEIATRYLGAKFAFSRAGFLSFKQASAVTGEAGEWRAEAAANLVFPLRTAFFVGKWTEGKGFAPIGGFDFKTSGFRRFHAVDVFTRKGADGAVHVLEPADLARRFPGALDGLAPTAEWDGEWNGCATPGERILTAIAVSEREVWFGLTDLRDAEFGWPGGESRIERSEGSPSRASVKIEEAIALLERKLGPVFKAGDRAIEIGAAPGGACHALLARGLKVVGVDRGEMAPVVGGHPAFTKVDSSIGDWMFPESISAEWIALDMNAEPRIALRESRPLVDYLKRGLRGVFFTFKLNQPELALNAERLAETTAKDLNLTEWFFKQLPSNHQEVAFFGVTTKVTAKAFVRKSP